MCSSNSLHPSYTTASFKRVWLAANYLMTSRRKHLSTHIFIVASIVDFLRDTESSTKSRIGGTSCHSSCFFTIVNYYLILYCTGFFNKKTLSRNKPLFSGSSQHLKIKSFYITYSVIHFSNFLRDCS